MIAALIIVSAFAVSLVLYALQQRATIRELRLTKRMNRKNGSPFTDSQMVNVAQQAGLAELNEGILRNIYHILNTVNVSTSVVTDKVERLDSKSLVRLANLMREHQDDLPAFLAEDPRGRKVPNALIQFSAYFENAHNALVGEMDELGSMVQKLNQIIKAQQAYANVEARVDQVDLSQLLGDALAMELRLLDEHQISVQRDLHATRTILAPKVKLLQVFVTLIRNGCETMVMHNPSGPWKLRAATKDQGERIQVEIGDLRALRSAEVVDPLASSSDSATLTRRHFSLYYCANAVQEMNGTFLIFSESPGHGALVRMEFSAGLGSSDDFQVH